MHGTPGSLSEYRARRRFDRTPEPEPRPSRLADRGLRYVVQKHAARNLHFDFRLEWDRVLKSWAVPKGPSPEPGVRRLAVEVEDHPVEYATFEGKIPHGEYGAGTVSRWDSGTWQPLGDAAAGLREGKLRFELRGGRLAGSWTLLRLRGNTGRQTPWLLFRTGAATATRRASSRANSDVAPAARRSPREHATAPGRIEPQLATPVAAPPEKGTWFSELKLDGYRILCRVDGDDVVCQARNGADWSARLPTIVQALRRLGLRDTWLDGELVAVDEHGRGHFQLLQRTLDAADQRSLLWYAFDVLWADGVDCRPLPLAERRVRLARLLAPARRDSPVRVLEYAPGYSDSVFDSVCSGSLEGVMLKQVDAPYTAGRSRTWLKLKCRNEQEFVVGGYTRVPGGRDTLSALLLGQFDGPGRLRYVGRAGSGFDRAALADLRTRLDAVRRETPPFEQPPRPRNGERVVWSEPRLVVQTRFAGWTEDGLLRLPRYAGLREDLAADSVQRREEPTARPGRRDRSRATPGATKPRLTNPARLVYRDEGITKSELAAYYATVERWLWPHLVERPVSLLRVTEAGRPYLQRHRRAGTPLPGFVDVPSDSKDTAAYLAAVDGKSLATLGQYSCVELHTWGCRLGALDAPDRLTFDLDPDPSLPWTKLRDAALLVRQLLEAVELESFVKTSGGRGLHVVVPLAGKSASWDEAAGFTSGTARHLARTFPHLYSDRAGARNRTGRVFVDHLRNRRTATTVAAYSPRFRAGAPVSMPLRWDDLGENDLRGSYSLRNAVAHADTRPSDPWQRYPEVSQKLTRRLVRRFPA